MCWVGKSFEIRNENTQCLCIEHTRTHTQNIFNFKPLYKIKRVSARRKQCLHNLFSIWMVYNVTFALFFCLLLNIFIMYIYSLNVSIWTGFGSSAVCARSVKAFLSLYNVLSNAVVVFLTLDSLSVYWYIIISSDVSYLFIYLFIHCYLFGIIFFLLLSSKHSEIIICFFSPFFSLSTVRVTEHIHFTEEEEENWDYYGCGRR